MKSLQFMRMFIQPQKRVRQKKPKVKVIEEPRVPPKFKQLDPTIPKEKLIEVGIMCFRDKVTGEFTHTKPIYQIATPELLEAKQKHEEEIVNEMSQMMLELMDIKEAKDGFSAY